ncbi:uracil-DNA glycosylase family protein [Rhodoferax sp.]|uniref:uracil-DNA glycosylase family protein n=1 Tax=Rhodoferax sp. TaxID=50421 RepID=UPI002778FCC8|nr:uracil-DNA glycosylase family protein [Rhodoferax sp.]
MNTNGRATSPFGSAHTLDSLLTEVRACRLCASSLPLGPRPVLVPHREARILVAGQAPGTKVPQSGIPFDDASGDRLRQWMGLDRAAFYDPLLVAFLPMGFCYPGRGASGDLPPRPECAATWRSRLLAQLPTVELVLLVGQYAQAWHLGTQRKATLTETVHAWRAYWPAALPLPHPSPRNNIWLKRNPWLELEVVPMLQQRVRSIIDLAR